MMKNSIFFLALFILSCGSHKGGMILYVELPKHLNDSEKETILKQVEFYRFHFKGSFPEKFPLYVERKKFKQYTFSDIPFDERLEIRVDAVSLNQQVTYCSGQVTVQYDESKNGQVIIPLECNI